MRRQHPYHYPDKLLLPFWTKNAVLGGRFSRPASFVNLRTRYSPYLKLMGNNTPTNQQERRPRKRRTPPKTVLFVQDSMIWLSVALLIAQNRASRDFPLLPRDGCARVGENDRASERSTTVNKNMTILYRVHHGLYVNLANRCSCACTFCVRGLSSCHSPRSKATTTS